MNRSTPRGSRRTLWLIFVAALTAGLGLHCGGETEQDAASVPEEPSSRSIVPSAVEQPESSVNPKETSAYKLAVAEKGADVAVDDPIVQRFAVAIGSLESKFEENRQQIAEITISGFTRLREESGESESHIGFLELVDQRHPTGSQVLTFAQYVDSYIKLKILSAGGESPLDNIGSRREPAGETSDR